MHVHASDERNLSHAQHQLWTGQQLSPSAPLYNMALAFTIDGDLDSSQFARSFAGVVASTDALRTVFQPTDDGVVRIVQREMPFELELVDLGDDDAAPRRAHEYVDTAARTLLDTSTRCFDSVLLRCGPQKHIWFLNQHHLIADAWSFTLVYDRVIEQYLALEAGSDVADRSQPGYESLIEFEASAEAASKRDAATEYFEDLLSADPVSPTNFHGRAQPEASTASTRVAVELDDQLMAKLHGLFENPETRSFTRDLTVFTALSAVTAAWVARTTGRSRFGLGFFSHNRPTPEFKQVAGMFVELFPMVCEVDPDDTFAALITRMSRQAMGSLRHAGNGASQPRFTRDINVVQNLITAELADFTNRSVRTTWLHNGHNDAGHDLRVQFYDFDGSGTLTAVLDFNDVVFDEQQRRFATDQFLQLLQACLDDPTRAVATSPFLGADELGLIQTFANASGAPAPADDDWLPVVRQIELRAQQHPDQMACSADGERLTYQELDHAANELAHKLAQHDRCDRGVVAICAERSVDFVIAALAAQKAGAAYLPIDPMDPLDRRKALAETSHAFAVIAHAPTIAQAHDLGVPVVRSDHRGSSANPPSVTIEQTDRAYILGTSGSTGTPKLIEVEHRNLRGLVDGLTAVIYDEHDHRGDEPLNVAVVAPFVFDPSVQQIFAALALGNCLHIVSNEARLDGARLMSFITDNKIDVCDGTPAHLRLLLSAASQDLAQLAVHFLIGGDVLPKPLARRFLEHGDPSQVKLTNLYGPAECCVDTTYWTVEPNQLDDYLTVPIGRTLPGATAFVIDEHDQLQPFGVVGELCIGGLGVGRGYLGDPDLTAEKFTDDPHHPGRRRYRTGDLVRMSATGVFEFVERTDLLVKVQGHRIELSEVEAALKSYRSKRKFIPLRPAEPVRCARCLLSELHPGVVVTNGVCSTCLQFDETEDAIAAYFGTTEDFEMSVQSARRAEATHDCMLLYSGGKDSSYVLHRLVDLGLSVLAFTFDNGHISDAAFANIARQTSRLNVESVVMATEHMDEIFLQSLNEESTVCGGCFRALTAISSQVAIDRWIGTVVTGLSRGQILDTKLAGLMAQGITKTDEIEDKLQFFRAGYHARQDHTSALLDVTLDSSTLESMNFVDWFRYDAASTNEVRSLLRSRDSYWAQPQDTGFCSSNCMMNDVGIAVHSATKGFHNYESPLSWDIRLGVLERVAGLEEVQPPADDRYVSGVLNDIGFLVREVQDGVVTVVKDESGAQQLHAFYVANQALPVEELRADMGRKLPQYMIPARFFQIDEIPLTENGKVDRAALRADQARPELSVSYSPPRNAIESALVTIWSDVLRIDEIGIHDNFFAIGGDSIKALEIVQRARQEGVEISAMSVFAATTIAALALVATQDDQAVTAPNPTTRPAPVARRAADEPPELSIAEQSLLVEQLQRPDDAMYNIARTYDVAGPVDVARFEEAMHQVVQHHEPLQWTFEPNRRRLSGDQAVACTVEPSRPDGAAVRDRIVAAQTAPFDLRTGPLVRCLIQPLDNGHTLVSLNLHHVSADHISLELLWKSLADIYAGRAASVPTVGLQDYWRWQSEGWDTDADYWSAQSFGLDVQFTPVSDSHDGYVESRTSLPASALRESADHSVFVSALTAAAVAVRPHFSSDKVELCLVASTRDHEVARPLIGYLLNPLPLQFNMGPEQMLASVARSVSEVTSQALVHRTYPFARIARDARQSDRDAPKAQVLVSVSDDKVLELDGAQVHHQVSFNGSAVAEIAFFLELQADQVVLGIEYSRRIGRTAAEAALVLFEESLESLIRTPETTLPPVQREPTTSSRDNDTSGGWWNDVVDRAQGAKNQLETASDGYRSRVGRAAAGFRQRHRKS